MKRIQLYICSTVCGCLLLASCADELNRENKPDITDGIPVVVMLPFQVAGAEIRSKATDEEEKRVSDLYILAFNKQGSLLEAQYYSKQQLAAYIGNQVEFKTTTGEQYLYAAANVTGNSFTSNGQHLKDQIDAFVGSTDCSLNAWKTFTGTISAEQVTWGDATFLMSGFFAKDAPNGDILTGEGLCTVTKDASDKGVITSEGRLQLVKSVAKVTFNIEPYSSSVSFTPVSWQVCNVPQSVYINRREAYGTPGDVFNTMEDKVTGKDFTFYMLENRQQARNERKTLTNTYDEADWREHPDNRPSQGTFVMLKGIYKGPEKNPFNANYPNVSPTQAEATVTYFIHLGYIESADDYSIRRNHHYIYNVKVKGVNEIIVEAYTGNESSREDGDVIFTDAQVIDVDAHYQRIEMRLNASELNNLSCGIQTAKTSFVFKDITEIEGSSMDDLDWVLFMEKGKANSLSNGPVFTKSNRSPGLMNIRELVAAFRKNEYPYGGTFYAYVAENYYEDLPAYTFANYAATGAERKMRSMMIGLRRQESPNSSVISAKYIIRQKPILSIYNLEDQEVRDNKTFGIEWVNENLPTNYTYLSYPGKAAAGLTNGYGIKSNNSLSLEDGLSNAKTEMAQNNVTSWNYPGIYMYDDLRSAKGFVACMSRNRDEDGNGYIEDKEIKWYLPAINQYQYLWVGTNVLPEEATLYPKDFRDNLQWEFYHYVSTGGHTFWSEEGNAIGNDFYTYGSGNFHVRCARNIGTGNTLMPIAEKSADNSTYIEIDVKNRLNRSSLRPIASKQLSKHDEYDENNKLYKKIRVVKKQYASYDWNTAIDNAYSTFNDCERVYGDGWRMPNQRELILITTVGGLNDISMPSATYFSLWNYETGTPRKTSPYLQQRMGFWFNQLGKNMTLTTNGLNEVFLRCVKDIE